ncbi:MAG: hypothetical protein ABIQ16_25805 [Polyangiaceae bacterium]
MNTSTTWGLRRNTVLGLGVGLALCALPRLAPAAATAAIPTECGSRSAFEAELRDRLGPNVSLDTTRVMLTPDVSGYRLVVEVGTERRELYDPNCPELMRAAVVIALALLEPRATETEAPREAKAMLSVPPRATQDGPRAMHFALAGGAGIHIGTVPIPTLLLDLDAQLKWTRWGVAVGFRYLLPSSERDRTDHGARVSGIGAYMAGTYEPWARVQARLGVIGYRLSGTGLGSVERSADTAFELGPTLGASFTPFQSAPFWTNVAAEGQLNLLRAHFDILNYGTVFSVPALSGSLFLRGGVVF